MNVLFVTSEVAPFAKTGGLGDVGAALPKALAKEGHDVRVVMPMYARVQQTGAAFEPVFRDASFHLGDRRIIVSVFTARLPHTDVPVYFVHCPSLYGRPSVYTNDPDEHLRFAVLSWAALIVAQRLGFRPDIVHANDWQTALLPLLLRTMFAWDRLFAETRSVLTIHNIGHQGVFDARLLGDTGLGPAAHHFHQDELREGRINYLLTGILYANAITTVSPTYAREIQTPEHGAGLDGFLRARRDVLFGILNGIDEAEWDPANDPHLDHRFSIDDLSGKEQNKKALLDRAGLPYDPRVPVLGVVSRFAWQKGFDLCFGVLPRLFANNAVQLVAIGTGEARYEEFFRLLARSFPRKVAYAGVFGETLAHRIEAGADLFLMPSRYEPCGLNQLYSLRYGTPPIVHKTGGLADTVAPFRASYTDEQRPSGNGFVFEHFDEGGLRYGLHQALTTWGSGTGTDRERWRLLQENGMRARHGWDDRVKEYERVYAALVPASG